MFDGLDDHVTLASIHDLALTGRFVQPIFVSFAYVILFALYVLFGFSS